MNVPDENVLVSGEVRDVTHRGEAVVETERGIVLARGGLPGEEVRLRVLGRSGGVARGTMLERVRSSPDRVTAPCELVERCGGCALMTLASPAQAAWKRERLRRALAAFSSNLEPDLVQSPRLLGYRVRARLAWRAAAGGWTLGYHAFASDELIDAAACMVLEPALGAGLRALREGLAPLLAGDGELALGLGSGGLCVADLTSAKPQAPAVYRAAGALAPGPVLAGVALRVGRGGAAAGFGDPRQLTWAVDGQPLWGPPQGFRQANSEVNAQLVARVVALAFEGAEQSRVLELYSGHGNLTVALAAHAAELRAVESDAEVAEACRENLRARGFTRVRVACAPAAEGARGRSKLDAVVLDPPRAGARGVLPALLERRPERIVYVSCDLATLRRDLGVLCASGYWLDAAVAADMFPQTPHVESVVRLRRVGSGAPKR